MGETGAFGRTFREMSCDQYIKKMGKSSVTAAELKWVKDNPDR